MEVNVYKLDGSVSEKVKLPEVFDFPYRPKIINRAVLAANSAKIQPKGAYANAGRDTSAVYLGRRGRPDCLMNQGIARKPRSKDKRRLIEGQVKGISGVVKGPKAHALKPQEIQKEEINRKEKLLALKSALSAIKDAILVKLRGHKFDPKLTLPVIVVDDLETVKKTKDVENFLVKLGLIEDIERAKDRKNIRAGKGKARGRKYKRAKSILFVVSKENLTLQKSARNLEGVDIVAVKNLCARDLAPGGLAGRLTIFTKSAIKNLNERKM